MLKFSNFVPNSTMETRQDTAVLLVGTAKEHGLTVRHHIASTSSGFFITDELAALVYDDSEDEDKKPDTKTEAPAKATKKTSGKQAAKTDSQKEE